MFKKSVAALILSLAVFTSAFSAHAGQVNGYPCSVTLGDSNSASGNQGYVWFNLFSSANCVGTYLGNFVVCSTGATSSNCTATSTSWVTDKPWMFSLFEVLSNVAAHDGKLSVTTGNCYGSSAASCLRGFSVY